MRRRRPSSSPLTPRIFSTSQRLDSTCSVILGMTYSVVPPARAAKKNQLISQMPVRGRFRVEVFEKAIYYVASDPLRPPPRFSGLVGAKKTAGFGFRPEQ